jgi:ABC-type multidrug transport system ATPase subunit
MNPDKSIILITHYQRLLDYINPTYVHVMQDGKIIKTGSAELAKELENKGYEWFIKLKFIKKELFYKNKPKIIKNYYNCNCSCIFFNIG